MPFDFGPQTLLRLVAVPFGELSDAGRSQALETLTRYSGYVDGVISELTALIAGPTPATDAARRDDFSAHEIAVATRCSVYAADAKVCFARDLSERLQATAAAMAAGRISERQARALSEATCHLDVGVAREVEEKLLRFAHRQDFTLFNASLRRWLARLDPNFTARADAARAECVVEHTAGDDGTGELFIRGPLEITTALSIALRAYAAKTKPELAGAAAQRKLAGLRDMTDRFLDAATCPKLHGRLPVLDIVVDLPTVLGMREHPAEIPDVGAIPADVARWLLADGAPLRQDGDRANRRARPPPHRAKTHADWTYTKNPATGAVIWTSPTSGLSYQIDPYDYRAGP